MIDVKKLKAALTKADISVGISEPDVWLSTGNYALNFNLTGNMTKGIPNRRTTMFWGLSGSGKTYLVSAAAKEAQDKGYFVVYIDTENALNRKYMEKIGVDLSEEKFMTVRVHTLEQITKVMSEFFTQFDEKDKVCYIADSLSMMETERELDNFNKGEWKADMGLFAKQLKLFMKNINVKIGNRDNFFICTNHAYANQDPTNGQGVAIPSGGHGFIFIPDISVYLSKLKLKEGKDVTGIRLTAETTKSRWTQLGKKITLYVPYDKGIDPIDGLLDIAVEAGIVDNSTKGWYKINPDTEHEIKFRGKDFDKYYMDLFDFDTDATEPVKELEEE